MMSHKGETTVTSRRVGGFIVVVLVLGVLIAGVVLFQPWKFFTSSTVDEAAPGQVASSPGVTSSSTPEGPGQAPEAAAAPGPAVPPAEAWVLPVEPTVTPAAATVVLRSGVFQSQEHPTTGAAQLLRLPDGSHVVRLENLSSSDGPDVKVWLSNLEAGGDWFKYRAGQSVDLGPVKATHGNQNYPVPPGVDVTGLTTVVLWCDRFSVAFGSADLT